MSDVITNLANSLTVIAPGVSSELNRLLNLARAHFSGADWPYVNAVVERYYWLYGAPVFGRAGYWAANRSDDQRRMQSLMDAHVWLSLHLRLVDNVIDRDAPPALIAKQLRWAMRALDASKAAIRLSGNEWGAEAEDLYELFLRYDEAVKQGASIEPDELWQRVSPLVIVPELYLRERLTPADAHYYRAYLNFMLLAHDLSDLFKDAQSGHNSLPTALLRRQAERPVFSRRVVETVFAGAETRLAQFADTLAPSLDDEREPVWTVVVGGCLRQFKSDGQR